MSTPSVQNSWKSDPQKALGDLKGPSPQTAIQQLIDFIAPLQKVLEQPVLRQWEFYAYVSKLASVDLNFSSDVIVKGCTAAIFSRKTGEDEVDDKLLIAQAFDERQISFEIDNQFLNLNEKVEKEWLALKNENATLTYLKDCATRFSSQSALSSLQKERCMSIFNKAKAALAHLEPIIACSVFKKDDFYRDTFKVLKQRNEKTTEALVDTLYWVVKGYAGAKSNQSSKHSSVHGTPSKEAPQSPPTSPGAVLGSVAARLEEEASASPPAPSSAPLPPVNAPTSTSSGPVTGAAKPLPKGESDVAPPQGEDAPLLPAGKKPAGAPKKKDDDCCTLI